MAAGETERPELDQEIETVRTALEAFGRAVSYGQIEPFLDLLSDDVDLEIPSALRQDVLKLHGRDEARRYLEETAGEYVELRFDPRQFRRLDRGRLLVAGRWHGRASGGTTPFGTPLSLIVELREGKLLRLHGFMDEQQALEA